MLAWDHNAYYHRTLLRFVPVGTERVLEVGCGRGHLAARLAERAERVDAIDLDPSMVAAAADLPAAGATSGRRDRGDRATSEGPPA